MHLSQHICHFFKCILEVVFCESVQHRLRFCLDCSVVSKWRPFSSIFSWRDGVGDDSCMYNLDHYKYHPMQLPLCDLSLLFLSLSLHVSVFTAILKEMCTAITNIIRLYNGRIFCFGSTFLFFCLLCDILLFPL
jgi:hypothetical protein